MGLLRVLFSFKGRANRAKFWLLLLFFVVYSAAVHEFSVGGTGLKFQSWQLELSINLSLLTLIYVLVAVSAKRLHDQNRSAKWLFAWFGLPVAFYETAEILDPQAMAYVTLASLTRVPGLAGWCALGYLVAGWTALAVIGGPRGTSGDNRFGPDPLAGKAKTVSE